MARWIAIGAAGVVAVAVALILLARDRSEEPADVAAVGDSITAGLRAGGSCSPEAVCPASSWATGTDPRVRSHLVRLRERDPGVRGSNFAVSGTKLGEMRDQADRAVAAGAGYVTLLGGANDACRESEAAMTPLAEFRSAAGDVIGKLAGGLPDARIVVASIPDPTRWVELFRADRRARQVWALDLTCNVFFGDPGSRAAAVVARRVRARGRVEQYNAALAAACAEHANCRYDGGAVFRWRPARTDVSALDYFHPSARGEARIAALTWDATQR